MLERSFKDYDAKKNLPCTLSKLSNILQLRKVSMSLHFSPSERLCKYGAAFVHPEEYNYKTLELPFAIVNCDHAMNARQCVHYLKKRKDIVYRISYEIGSVPLPCWWSFWLWWNPLFLCLTDRQIGWVGLINHESAQFTLVALKYTLNRCGKRWIWPPGF